MEDYRFGKSIIGDVVFDWDKGFAYKRDYPKAHIPDKIYYPASYIVVKDGDIIYAKNGRTGEIEYQGTDASTVIQNAINEMSEGDRITVKGDVIINSPILITKPIIYEHYGKATLNSDYLVIGDDNHWVNRSRFYIHYVDGQAKANGYTALKLQGCAQSVFEFDRITNCGYGIYIVPVSSNVSCIDNKFIGGLITYCNYGIYIYPTLQSAEGNEFHLRIFNSDHGIYINQASSGSAVYTAFYGTIDNTGVSGSKDIEDYVGKNLFAMQFVRTSTYSILQDTSVLIAAEDVAPLYFQQPLYLHDKVFLAEASDESTGSEMTHLGTLEVWRSDGYPAIDLKTDKSTDYDVRIRKTADHALQFIVGGASSLVTALTIEPDGHVNATNYGIKTKYFIGDYGGGFANFTPPTGEEGLIIIAIDTNATTPGKRLYVYANSTWNYVDLT